MRARFLHVLNTSGAVQATGCLYTRTGSTGKAADFPDRGDEYMQETFLTIPEVLAWTEALGVDAAP